ncbi:MAG: hypothetical protein AB3N63_17595 [Puniceicoccaceae bacterium]
MLNGDRTVKLTLLWVALLCCVSALGRAAPQLSDKQIIKEINRHRPLLGAQIPEDIKDRLGTTHVGGKYYLTNEPFLLEGSRQVQEFGFGVIKLWFRSDSDRFYSFNSDWDIEADLSLTEVAQHPYWRECFDMPFSTFALSIAGAGIRTTDETAAEEAEEVYQLSKYLLEEYRDREITFILHNWEGDWIFRGGTGPGSQWSLDAGMGTSGKRKGDPVPGDITKRIDAMVKWFTARQSGVDRARKEAGESKCRVVHAIEANKVLDSMTGIPGIVNSVLPHVEVDMVSWSSYDGLDMTGLNLFKGIQYIKEHIRPTLYMNGKRIVFIGEIGMPENTGGKLANEETIVNRWDAFLGACLAADVPYIIQWELYCNEPKDRSLKRIMQKRSADELRGFWLIRPDGSLGFAGEYFDEILSNPGNRIR